MPNLITLCTDFGHKDYFVASVKGALLTELENCTIIDISHEIMPFHREEAAYIMRNAYKSFPKGTVHIIGVDATHTPEHIHIVVLLDGHYFIVANNGILSLISATVKPSKIVAIDQRIKTANRVGEGYPILDVFIQVAAHIARGGAIEVLGKSIDTLQELSGTTPQISLDKNEIKAPVIYIDNYGNAITSLSKNLFEEVRKGRRFSIYLPSGEHFDTILEDYDAINNYDDPNSVKKNAGKALLLFNASDDLEIAIYKSNKHTVGAASNLLGIKYLDIIQVRFFD
jgi:S-adenosylmethionine hydrolase